MKNLINNNAILANDSACLINRVTGTMLIDLARQAFGIQKRINDADIRFHANIKLSINPKTKTFFDHSTGEGGGVLAFICYLGLASNNRQAAEWVEKQFEIGGLNG